MNTNEVGRRYLMSLAAMDEDGDRDPSRFLNDPPEIDGLPITEVALKRGIERAEHDGLIKTWGSLGSTLPVMVKLLPPGRECVEEFAGDMAAFAQARRGPVSSTTYHNTITMGDYGQASAFTSGNVAQTATITQIVTDPERLRDVARAAQEIVPLLPEHSQDEVREAAKEVAAAAEDPADETRLRKAGARLVTALGPASSLFTVARFIVDALSGGLGG